jgi:peptidyl-prolyl cis-trans isomerase D
MAKSPRSYVSTKQQNRVEKEKRQRKIVIYSSIAVAVLVVLVLGYGLLNIYVLQPNRPVASVDGTKVSMESFQTRVRYDRYQLIQNMIQLAQYNQMFGTDPTTGAGMFDSQISSYNSQLSSAETMGNQAIQELINDIVMSKKAAEMGITVSDAEVEQAIQEAFGYYKDGTPTPTVTPTEAAPYATATYSSQQLTLVPYTATPTNTPTPEATATGLPTATSAPTLAPTATVDPNAATATPYPTATAYTEDGYKGQYSSYVSGLETDAGLTEADFRALFRSSLIYQKLSDAVNTDLPTTDTYIWARHILVATEDEANVVYSALKEGASFTDMAAQYSTDTGSKDSGGDLGWFTRGQMVTEFEDAVFAMTDIGEISKPVKSDYGYHIIQVLGREDRPITADRLDSVKSENFTKWLDDVKASMKIETYDTWQNYVPTTPVLPDGVVNTSTAN